MRDQDIYTQLADLMSDVFEVDDLQIGPDTTARDIAGWDSQAHIMLIVATEQHFGVRFKTAEFEALRNVGEFVRLIDAKLGAG